MWPDKEAREKFEIEGVIEAYTRLPEARVLKVVAKRERPDWIVEDASSGEEFGVELTSVYSSDRSVPDHHMGWERGEVRHNPYCEATLRQYKGRIVAAIEDKIRKAAGYDTSRPLILAIYLNEYIGIYLDGDELNQLVEENRVLFDNMHPFSEIAFWALPDGAIFCVRPS